MPRIKTITTTEIKTSVVVAASLMLSVGIVGFSFAIGLMAVAGLDINNRGGVFRAALTNTNTNPNQTPTSYSYQSISQAIIQEEALHKGVITYSPRPRVDGQKKMVFWAAGIKDSGIYSIFGKDLNTGSIYSLQSAVMDGPYLGNNYLFWNMFNGYDQSSGLKKIGPIFARELNRVSEPANKLADFRVTPEGLAEWSYIGANSQYLFVKRHNPLAYMAKPISQLRDTSIDTFKLIASESQQPTWTAVSEKYFVWAKQVFTNNEWRSKIYLRPIATLFDVSTNREIDITPYSVHEMKITDDTLALVLMVFNNQIATEKRVAVYKLDSNINTFYTVRNSINISPRMDISSQYLVWAEKNTSVTSGYREDLYFVPVKKLYDPTAIVKNTPTSIFGSFFGYFNVDENMMAWYDHTFGVRSITFYPANLLP